MRIVSLMHVAFEDAANLGVWAAERGHTVEEVHVYAGQQLPTVGQFDGVFVMGGPMNVDEDAAYPWLAAEKRFLAHCLDADKMLVGVCLGAQLIAGVLGGTVTQNARKEIGWYDVFRADTADESIVAEVLPERFWAFHWHGDTFSIPPGALRLAGSAACENQGFSYGRRVLGLQCHLEYSVDSIEKMLIHCAEELIDGPSIQTTGQIREGYVRLPDAKALLWRLLDSLSAEIGD